MGLNLFSPDFLTMEKVKEKEREIIRYFNLP